MTSVQNMAKFIYEAHGITRYKTDGTYWLEWEDLPDAKQTEWIAVAGRVLDKIIADGEHTPLPELLGFMTEQEVENHRAEIQNLLPHYLPWAGEFFGRLVEEHKEMLKEIADYGIILDHCSKVYDWATNGRISKPFTYPSTVIGEAEDIRSEEFRDYMEDELEGCAVLEADEAMALYDFLRENEPDFTDDNISTAYEKLKKTTLSWMAKQDVENNG